MADPVTIAQILVRCPSVTPNEGGAITYLAGLLAEAGFAVNRPVFSAPGTPDVENLYARIGDGNPCLIFAGHTDVVPPGNEALWSRAPFSGEIADGYLWGRGAEDMKGGVAASVAAVLQHLKENGIPKQGSIAFLITGDEEGPAINGTLKLLKWAKQCGEPMDHCVLGEPTNPQMLGDMMKAGRRGSLTGEILLRGKQGHVAYPQLAFNPVPAMAKAILALKETPLDNGNGPFLPSNLEVTTVDVGNAASNVIPAEIRASFNIRFNDLWTPDTLADEIKTRVMRNIDPALHCEVRFQPTNAVAFQTRPGPFLDLVAGAIQDVTGRIPEVSTSGGTSDARFIKDYAQVIEFGLVGATMHQIDERVAVADIVSLTKVYRRVIERYFFDREQ